MTASLLVLDGPTTSLAPAAMPHDVPDVKLNHGVTLLNTPLGHPVRSTTRRNAVPQATLQVAFHRDQPGVWEFADVDDVPNPQQWDVVTYELAGMHYEVCAGETAAYRLQNPATATPAGVRCLA